jgi:hypothetical protein
MKCKECDKEAEWLVTDFDAFDELFMPLCEEHLDQLLRMEGEINVDFNMIDNLTVGEVIAMANEKWKCLRGKYLDLLKIYSEIVKKAKFALKL